MNRQILISLTGLFMVSGLLAQVPKYSNEFLSIGVGARSFGMSHAVVASTIELDVLAGYLVTLFESPDEFSLPLFCHSLLPRRVTWACQSLL